MSSIIQFFAARNIRHTFGSSDKRRDAGQTTPADIMRYDNILYGNDRRLKKWQLLDVYRPKNALESDGSLKKLPVIVSVHGGAWVYGDKNRYQFYCMRLAQRGFAVINYSYRLAPEAKFPSSMQDTESVFQWACANADQYGFDTSNFFAVGDSAGGHLLSLYCDAITNAEYKKNYPFIKDKKMTLRAVALNCGKYTLDDSEPKFRLLRKGYLPHGGTPEEVQLINSAAHVTKDFPPAFIMTCIGDFLYNQADIIKKALDKAGVRNELHCYGSQEKALWHVFHCDPKLPEAVICNDDECNFFRSFISSINK